MKIFYRDLGSCFVCCRLDGMLIVDIKYQREFEEYMLLYKIEDLDIVMSEFQKVIGL